MIWGCMSGLGVGKVYQCEGAMNQYQYLTVLEECMLMSGLVLFGKDDFIFQQDNAPCHKARRVTQYLQESGVTIMEWPAQSPDLNPIENLWRILGQKVENKQPSNKTELWTLLKKEWETMDPSICQKLVESMPKRVRAVIKAKGHHTKY